MNLPGRFSFFKHLLFCSEKNTFSGGAANSDFRSPVTCAVGGGCEWPSWRGGFVCFLMVSARCGVVSVLSQYVLLT